MFHYLFKHQIKTDEDYKRYHLVWFPLMIVLAIGFVLVAIKASGRTAAIYGFVTGITIPLVCYGIWFFVLLTNPKRLLAARLKLTDERRKLVEQELWSHVGQVMTFLLAVAVLYTALWKPILLDSTQLTIVFYLIFMYKIFKTRK